MSRRARTPLALLLPLLAHAGFANVLSAQVETTEPEYTGPDSVELSALADRGELDVDTVLAALDGSDGGAAYTAAAIVRHEWRELPDALFEGLDERPRAAVRMLEELVRAPRPAASGWVERQAREKPGRSVDHRLLAIAALGRPITREQAELLLTAAKAPEEPGDGFWFASAVLPSEVADRLLGRVHGLLLQDGVPLTRVAPLFDRLSMRGTKSLLGLAVTLPYETAREILQRVQQSRPELVEERVTAALDGRVPLEGPWLTFASPYLRGHPERIDRMLELATSAEHERTRDDAFSALVQARVVDGRVLELTVDDEQTDRILQVIRRASDEIPADRVVAWLRHDPTVMQTMAQALERRPVLEPEVQRELLAIVDGFVQVERNAPLHALAALVHGGDAEALQRVWPLLLNSPAWPDLLDRVGQRDEPFVYARLLAALTEKVDAPDEPPAGAGHGDAKSWRDVREAQRDTIRLLLVARGDRNELDGLLDRIGQRDATFLRRCGHYVRRLTAEQARKAFDAALATDDVEVATELLEWVMRAQPEASQPWLWQLWQSEPETDVAYELQEVAVRLLARGERRAQLLRELRREMRGGPLPDNMASLPYEALNGMQDPLDRDDLALCAELLLELPLRDPDNVERQRRRWTDGTFGFPLVQAIARRMRAADVDVAVAAFDTVVARVRENPRRELLLPQRLKVFWRSLAVRPDLQLELGIATVPLWPDAERRAADEVHDGCADYLLAVRAERAGALDEAERRYAAAARQLLRLPETRAEVRWLLGDRDPIGGDDPLARLSAAPYRMQWLRARAASDDDDDERGDHARAAARAAQLVREFQGRDRATREALELPSDPRDESGR